MDAAGNVLGGEPKRISIGHRPGIVTPARRSGAEWRVAGKVILRSRARCDDIDASRMGGIDMCKRCARKVRASGEREGYRRRTLGSHSNCRVHYRCSFDGEVILSLELS